MKRIWPLQCNEILLRASTCFFFYADDLKSELSSVADELISFNSKLDVADQVIQNLRKENSQLKSEQGNIEIAF